MQKFYYWAIQVKIVNKFVKEYSSTEVDTISRALMQYELEVFRPYKPFSEGNLNLIKMIDTLISYLNSNYNYIYDY